MKKRKVLTRKEVAAYLKIGLNSADRIIKNRNFNGKVKIGRRILVIKSKLDDFVNYLLYTCYR